MNETFGQRLLKLRKKKNLTQEAIAKKLNMSPQAISKWENDVSLPDISVLIELSEILDVSVDELLGKEKTKTLFVSNNKDDNLMVKLIIDTNGTKVNLNLPIDFIKTCLKNNQTIPLMNSNNGASNINFSQLLEQIEMGVRGEVLSISLDDGTIIKIIVE